MVSVPCGLKSNSLTATQLLVVGKIQGQRAPRGRGAGQRVAGALSEDPGLPGAPSIGSPHAYRYRHKYVYTYVYMYICIHIHMCMYMYIYSLVLLLVECIHVHTLSA